MELRMKKLKKPLVLSLAAATAFFCALSLAGCGKDPDPGIFTYRDYGLSLHIEKAEYTLSELEANGYRIPIDIIYTNTSEEAIKYENGADLIYDGFGYLFTHKENGRYIAFYKIGELTWQGVDLLTSGPLDRDVYISMGAPIPNLPETVEPGESLTLKMYYDFSDMKYGKDGEVTSTIKYDILYLNPLPDNEKSDESFATDTNNYNSFAQETDHYNFDYSLGDDEEYLAVGLGSYAIYGPTKGNGSEEVPTQTGYYSLVFGSTVFVNCIHITEE